MCECGCGDLTPLTKLRAPGGWYAVEFYPGCDNCGNLDCAVGVTFIPDGDEDVEWVLGSVEEADFGTDGQWGTPVLDAGLLKQRFAEYDEDADEFSVAKAAFEEFLSRGELRQIHFETVQQFRAKQNPPSDGEMAVPDEETDGEEQDRR